MIPRLRTIAFLMLLAGLSLGIFTSRALRAMGGDDDAGPRYRIGQQIELRLAFYRDEYGLNPQQLDRIEQELRGYERSVDDLIWQLRVENADKFQALREGTEARIQAVLDDARNDE
jgi:hypothetical protein